MKVAINGFGRIGRLVFRIGVEKKINFVAINDLADIDTLVYLLKFDSVYGKFKGEIEAGKNFIRVNGKKILVLNEKDPTKLPWKKLKVDYVVESTGVFREYSKASMHLRAGAKRVLITAASDDADRMVVYGVNHFDLKRSDRVISLASCTTNCLTPIVSLLEKNFGVNRGFMTTVHGLTSSQMIVDSPHKKLRRGRAAGENIVPTTSGATTATAKIIPQISGRLDGLALRVPIPVGSIVDFVAELGANVTKEKLNEVFKEASRKELKGVLEYSEDELVSSDVIANPHSSIVDSKSTQVMGNMVKILSWYDNEYGYSCRVVDLIKYLNGK